MENRVLRRTFRPNKEEAIEHGNKLYKKELHNMYSSRSVIRVIKSRRMK
jgi:hypothetical protein